MSDRELLPARKYVAQAIPRRVSGGYLARFAAPGMPPQYVLDGRGEPIVFGERADAEGEAAVTLVKILNERPSVNRRVSREHPSSATFSLWMRLAGMKVEDVALLAGSRPERVREWIDGLKPVPFWVWWALPLLRQERIREWAFQQAKPHVFDRSAGGEED